MIHDEDRLLRLKQQRSKEAIDLAMQARWKEAATANKEIIHEYPEDVDAYNRLGRAFMELGQYPQARDAYQHAVKLDPYNAIANRNLRRLADIKDTRAAVDTEKVEPQRFIEEIGKAGVVVLTDLAPKEKRAITVAGDKAVLKVKASSLAVENGRGDYLGKVEPKAAQRLIRLVLGGNKYSAVVVRSAAEGMTVMIRETYQHPKMVGKLSFPPKGMEEFRAYGSDKFTKLEEEEEETGYTIIGGDEVEVLPEESEGSDDSDAEEE